MTPFIDEKIKLKFRVHAKTGPHGKWSEKWGVGLTSKEEFQITDQILKLPHVEGAPKIICTFSVPHGRLLFKMKDTNIFSAINGNLTKSGELKVGDQISIGEKVKIDVLVAPSEVKARDIEIKRMSLESDGPTLTKTHTSSQQMDMESDSLVAKEPTLSKIDLFPPLEEDSEPSISLISDGERLGLEAERNFKIQQERPADDFGIELPSLSSIIKEKLGSSDEGLAQAIEVGRKEAEEVLEKIKKASLELEENDDDGATRVHQYAEDTAQEEKKGEELKSESIQKFTQVLDSASLSKKTVKPTEKVDMEQVEVSIQEPIEEATRETLVKVATKTQMKGELTSSQKHPYTMTQTQSPQTLGEESRSEATTSVVSPKEPVEAIQPPTLNPLQSSTQEIKRLEKKIKKKPLLLIVLGLCALTALGAYLYLNQTGALSLTALSHSNSDLKAGDGVGEEAEIEVEKINIPPLDPGIPLSEIEEKIRKHKTP